MGLPGSEENGGESFEGEAEEKGSKVSTDHSKEIPPHKVLSLPHELRVEPRDLFD